MKQQGGRERKKKTKKGKREGEGEREREANRHFCMSLNRPRDGPEIIDNGNAC